MEFLESILALLKKPFPDDLTLWRYTKISIALSLFVAFFLYVFRPFGLATLGVDTFLICLGFGSMTFVGAMVYELTIGQLLRVIGLRVNWTYGKWILNTLGAVIFISVANFIFGRLIDTGTIDWSLFPAMLYGTFMIGILPVSALGAWLVSQQEKKYEGIANEINQVPGGVQKINASTQTIFDIATAQIKYIEALQNYVKVGYLNSEDSLKIQTERMTLKEVLKITEGSSITQCHRSYLVNQDAVISASGNAQGLMLALSDCEKTIPVSRAFVSQFRHR